MIKYVMKKNDLLSNDSLGNDLLSNVLSGAVLSDTVPGHTFRKTIWGISFYLMALVGLCVSMPSGYAQRTITGNLTISDAAEIDSLSDVVEITGNLIIRESSLKTLSGFPRLKRANSLIIAINASLESISGFDSLESITKDIGIWGQRPASGRFWLSASPSDW